MLRFVFKLIFDSNKWQVVNNHPEETQHCVMIGAPHTSNWDFVYAIAAFEYLKIPFRFTIKKEWMKFPFGGIMRSLGAIGIDRTPKNPGEKRKSTVEAMVDLMNAHKRLAIVVTPEGTRKPVKKLKTGFYYVALNAKVPIALGFMDYKRKVAGIEKIIHPSGDIQADFAIIRDYYKTVSARYPEQNSMAQPDFETN